MGRASIRTRASDRNPEQVNSKILFFIGLRFADWSQQTIGYRQTACNNRIGVVPLSVAPGKPPPGLEEIRNGPG
jgi:hypothetical protein